MHVHVAGECWFPKVQLWACGAPGSDDFKHGGSGNQRWALKEVNGGTQLVMRGGTTGVGMCLTAVKGAAGWAVGLDAGVKVTATQVHPCIPGGAANQTFLLQSRRRLADDGDDSGSFAIRTADGMCLMPELEKLPHFDAVAFEQPDGLIPSPPTPPNPPPSSSPQAPSPTLSPTEPTPTVIIASSPLEASARGATSASTPHPVHATAPQGQSRSW